MKTVKNVSGQTLTVAGVGIVQPEQVIEMPEGFSNLAGFSVVNEEPVESKSEQRRKAAYKETDEAPEKVD